MWAASRLLRGLVGQAVMRSLPRPGLSLTHPLSAVRLAPVNTVAFRYQKYVSTTADGRQSKGNQTDQDLSSSKRTQNEPMFDKLKEIRAQTSILQILESPDCSLNITTLGESLVRIAVLQATDASELELADLQYKKKMKEFNRHLHQANFKAQLGWVGTLLHLSDEDSPLLKSLEMSLLSSVFRAPIGSVITTTKLHMKRSNTDLRRSVLTECHKTLGSRVSELQFPDQLAFCLSVLPQEMDLSLSILIDVIKERLVDMSSEELCLILNSLRIRRLYDVPLLELIVFYLKKMPALNLDHKKLVGILFSFSKLKQFDKELLQKLTTELYQVLEDESVQVPVSSMVFSLRSLSQILWRDMKLIERYLVRIEESVSSLDPSILEKLFMVMARLNCRTSDTENVIQRLFSHSNRVKEAGSVNWLSTVYSCAQLGLATEDDVQTVLTPDFYTAVLDELGEGSYRSDLAQTWLLQLLGYAELELGMTDCNVQETDRHNWWKTQEMSSVSGKHKLGDQVLKVLQPEACVQQNVLTKYGHHIDGEAYVDGKGLIVPDTDKDKEGIFRVAINCLQFKTLMHHQSGDHLTGLQSMQQRHLQKMGYSVVQIPYYEWSLQKTDVAKISYVEKKIKESIQGEEKEVTQNGEKQNVSVRK